MPEQTLIRLLTGGDVIVAVDPPIEWKGRSAKALFAILALHPGQPQERERLAALLWPESDRHASRANLRMALLLLRRSLAPVGRDLVHASNDTIMLDVAAHEVDRTLFEQLAGQTATDARMRALELYSGDLCDAIPNNYEAAGELMRDERERLRNVAVALGLDLASAFEADGDDRKVLAAVERTIAIDPANETAHRTAMKVHARAGDRAAALRQFELCQRALADVYDVGPSPTTVALRDSIMADASRLAPEKGGEEPSPEAPLPVPGGHVPATTDLSAGVAAPVRRWRTAKAALGGLAAIALVAAGVKGWTLWQHDYDMQHLIFERIEFTDLDCAQRDLEHRLRIAMEDRLSSTLDIDVLLAPVSRALQLGEELNWILKTDAQCIDTDFNITIHLYRSDQDVAEWIAQHRGRGGNLEVPVERIVEELRQHIEDPE